MEHQRALGGRFKGDHAFQVKLELILEMLVIEEGEKPENAEKNPQSRHENQQQTQPTDEVESRNRRRATMVGGKCS